MNSGLYDASVIDDRNQRPLTIAFVTIVIMWMALGNRVRVRPAAPSYAG